MTFEIDLKEVSLSSFFLHASVTTRPQLGRKGDKKMKMLIS